MSEKKLAVLEIVTAYLEAKRKAQPGTGPAPQRAAARAEADRLWATLPKGWKRYMTDDLWAAMAAVV